MDKIDEIVDSVISKIPGVSHEHQESSAVKSDYAGSEGQDKPVLHSVQERSTDQEGSETADPELSEVMDEADAESESEEDSKDKKKEKEDDAEDSERADDA